MFYLWLIRHSVTVNAKHVLVSSDHVVDHVAVNPAALLEGLDTFGTPEIQPSPLICSHSSFKSWPVVPMGVEENPSFHNRSD